MRTRGSGRASAHDRMREFRLADHVRFCEFRGRRIFLDLLADRYFSLPPATDAAFSALLQAGGWSSPAAIEGLRRQGLLVPAPGGRRIEPTSNPAPDRSLVEEADGPGALSILAAVEVLCLALLARRTVRRRRLAAEFAARPNRRPGQSLPPDRRDRAVLIFLRARRLVPIAPNCLRDSIALRRFLLRRRIHADLVIGAKLDPFAAHCWLQDGSTVLNDSLGSARDFVPILVA